jgi:4,5-dihydroxyphthalate decarboxylase
MPAPATLSGSRVAPLSLRIALGNHAHVADIKNGSIAIPGVEADFVSVSPMIAAYRRMVRDLEFDVSELAPTTYLTAKAFGAPFTGLPLVMTRRFHHAGLLCRDDAGISAPQDLHGQRVGVRAYTVTAGVWTRGVLMREYGLDATQVTWVVDDEEHVAQLRLPANVVHAPAGRSLEAMMVDGEIAAGFAGAAGIGNAPARVACHDLFPDAEEREAAWFRRTGVYPIHGVIVIKDELLAQHPWLAGAIFEAFCAAKDRYLDRLADGSADGAEDRRYRKLMSLVGDPLPYGLTANRPAIETLIEYAVLQGVMPRRLSVEELFLDLDAEPAPALQRART